MAAATWRIFLSVITTITGTNAGAQTKLYTQHGSTRGVLTDRPEWSGGIQLGNGGATGFCFEKYGLYEGSVTFAAGLAYGTVTLGVDYHVVFNSSFQRLKLATNETYNSYRGLVQPYVGGGVQLADGFSLRVPFGVQYTMLKDPFNFFGGVAMLYGRFLDKTDGAEAELWYNVGARVLL